LQFSSWSIRATTSARCAGNRRSSTTTPTRRTGVGPGATAVAGWVRAAGGTDYL
jgi:hypothetical protein